MCRARMPSLYISVLVEDTTNHHRILHPVPRQQVPGDAQSLDQSSQRALILVMKPVRAWLFCPPSGQFQPRDLKNCRNWCKGRMRQLPPTPISLSHTHTHMCTCTHVQEGAQAEQGRTRPITAEGGGRKLHVPIPCDALCPGLGQCLTQKGLI